MVQPEKQVSHFADRAASPGPDTVTAGPPSTLSAGQVICDRYQILRFIGRGGMGEVYEAKDLELRTQVALKTIRPEFSTIPGTLSRFKDEIRLARRITHRSVCRVYHLESWWPAGDRGRPGITFIIMELLEGETLAARLRRQGRMTTDGALPLVRQIADGLAAAHQAGVVHCDFKPGNVMLVGEGSAEVDSMESTKSARQPQIPLEGAAAGAGLRAVITDFGLARAIAPSPQESVPGSFSVGGQLVGTPAYMAPEQLEGKKATAASDIYALGLVMYEIVTARQPFPRDAQERLRELPPSPRTHVPGLDARWEAVILRCLERDPAARYPSTRDVARALAPTSGGGAIARWFTSRRLWIGAGLAFLALLAGALRFVSVRGPKPPAKGENLVVLPFTAVGGRPEEVAYCDGFTETVTTRLGQSASLAVPPAFEVRRKHVDSAEEAGKEFGATVVIQATWQRLGDHIRIDLALVDARTLLQRQATIVDGTANDLFGLQNQVVEAAVAMLDAQSPASMAQATNEPVAYDYFIQGRGYLQQFQKPESVESAVQAFKKAIQIDPKYGLAHAGLGESYWRTFEHTKVSQLVQEAREECARAVHLGNGGAEAYICLGTVYNGTGQYEEAADQYQRAITLAPTDDDGYIGLAQAYEGLNKIEDAVGTYRKAIELRPDRITGYNWLGVLYQNHGNYRGAAEMFLRVTTMAPDNSAGHSNLGAAYLGQGAYSAAVQEFQRSLALRPTYYAYSNLGTAYFDLRRFAEAARNYETAIRISAASYDVWGNLGDAYTWAPGESEKARPAYEQAILRATEALAVNPRDYATASYRATYRAMLGQQKAALTDIEHALQLAPNDADTMFNAAHVYNQLGDTDRAIFWLRRCLAAGAEVTAVRDSPYFNSLRQDSRFKALVRNTS